LKYLIDFLKHPTSRSIGFIFGISGFIFGTWVTRIPEIKHKLALSDGELGLALFGIPLGALIIMPVMGSLTGRFGAGRVTIISTYLLCFFIFPPALATDFSWLVLALIFFGLTLGGMDIAMNATAATVEHHLGRTIMSSCHGFWSLGGMLGAGTGSLAYGLKLPFLAHVGLLCGLLLLLSLRISHILKPIRFMPSDEPLFSLPGKALFILALVGFCSFFGEGAIADWSAIYMEDSLHASGFLTGLAYAGFSFMMALGRFFGDAIIDRIGAKRVVRMGASLATLSIGLLLLMGHPIAAIIGFALAGLGFSLIVPVVFSAAAKVPGMRPATSIAAVGSMGYFGLLLGPPFLGFVSDSWGLPSAISLVAMLCALAAILINFHRL